MKTFNIRGYCLLFIMTSVCVFLTKVSAQQIVEEIIMPADAERYRNDTIQYLRYLPTDYHSSTKKYPLLIFLHGAGESRNYSCTIDNVQTVCYRPISVLLEATGTIPNIIHNWTEPTALDSFIVISPQSPHPNWYPVFVRDILDHLADKYPRIDQNRVYITGLSAGGKGTWQFAETYPERVAAIIPIASSGPVDVNCDIRKVPVWAFIGSSDGTSERAWVAAYNSCSGQEAGLTTIEGGTHSSSTWGVVYRNLSRTNAGIPTGLVKDNIYHWLLKYNIDGSPVKTSPFANTGGDKKITLPVDSVLLNGSGYDEDGIIVSYHWTQVSGPSVARISDPFSANTYVADLIEGTYQFSLTVTDNDNRPGISVVNVVVEKESLGNTVVLYRVNSGGRLVSDPVMDWLEDTQNASAFKDPLSSSLTTGNDFWNGINTTDAPNNIFGNFRYDVSPAGPMAYIFPVDSGSYLLKLYFLDQNATTAGSRIFNVLAEDQVILQNFDIYEKYGNNAGQENFLINVEDGALNLVFETITGYPRIDAVAVEKVIQGSDGGIITQTETGNLHFPSHVFSNYPIPATDLVTCKFSANLNDQVTIELMDLFGISKMTIYSGIVHSIDPEEVFFSVKDLEPGPYLVILRTSSGLKAQKIFKK